MNSKVSPTTESDSIAQAKEFLLEGEVVAIPTETVYGLAANGLDGDTVQKIFVAKGRPQDNPLILHIGDEDQLSPLVKEIPEKAKRLMDTFWPGPLTIIFEKADIVPMEVTAGGNTVGVRMPSHPWTKKLLEELPFPLAAPSANRSGRPSPTDAKSVLQDMNGMIPLIIDGGDASIGLESTVIDMTDTPTILRPGFITKEDIEEVIGQVTMDPHLENENVIPKAPGQKYRHYAPKAKVFLYDEAPKADNKRCVCLFGEALEHEFSLGDEDDLSQMARALFRTFRLADEKGYEEIWVPKVPRQGWGYAIMNRLEKAAGGKE